MPAPGWCEAAENAAWKAALARAVVPLSRTASIVPMTPAHDGRTFFAAVWTPTFSGVARIDPSSGTVTQIKEFADAVNDQAFGNFDGRWLVWREDHSLYDWNEFDVWSWDSRSGRAMQIGASTNAPDGQAWPSTWRAPEVHGGIATWEQGSGPDDLGEVHTFDLASGRDRVVRRGHPQGSFFYAGLVVWSESLRRGAATVMRAVDPRNGEARAVPAALHGIRGVSGLFTDGKAIAYPDGHYKSLWWSPSPSVAPKRLFGTKHLEYIANSVRIAGRYIVFGADPHTYLLDTKAKRYVEIHRAGFGVLDGGTIVVLKRSPTKAIHVVTDILFLPLASLPPIPHCR